MRTNTIESVRWMDIPARVVAVDGNENPKAWLQATAPSNIEAMCKGRLAEEIPRISTMLSPSHHLASAMALDRLFGVEPPALAVNTREALLQAQFLTAHLRKLYFLLTAFENPFEDFSSPRKKGPARATSKELDDIMKRLALAQEACAILGGRSDHPLTALPGGVSRFLKDELYDRLEEIAEALLDATRKTAVFFTERFFADAKALKDYAEIGPGPLPCLFLDGRDVEDPENVKEGEIAVADPSGKRTGKFATDKVEDNIGLATEPWTREPFAFFKESGWKGVGNGADGFFLVGPLARLNSGKELSTPEAEKLRQKMVEEMGAFPHYTVPAAFRALVVESVGAAEKLAGLCTREKLAGPSIRQIPKQIGQEGHAALESPQGLIRHWYRVDERGVVKDIRILDVSAENNASRCLAAQKAFESAVARKYGWDRTKNQIEVSLLPFWWCLLCSGKKLGRGFRSMLSFLA